MKNREPLGNALCCKQLSNVLAPHSRTMRTSCGQCAFHLSNTATTVNAASATLNLLRHLFHVGHCFAVIPRNKDFLYSVKSVNASKTNPTQTMGKRIHNAFLQGLANNTCPMKGPSREIAVKVKVKFKVGLNGLWLPYPHYPFCHNVI